MENKRRVVESSGCKHFSGVCSDTIKSSKDLFDIASESVFPIEFIQGENVIPLGSCFLYKIVQCKRKTLLYFLTNLHVIRAVDMLREPFFKDKLKPDETHLAVNIDNKLHTIEKVFVPKGIFWEFSDAYYYLDFAIFSIEEEGEFKRRFFSISQKNDLAPGSKVYAFGYPLGSQLTVTEGLVSNIHNKTKSFKGHIQMQNIIQHSILLNPGNSGGPTVDEYGNIVGISTRGMRFGTGINYSLDIEKIVTFIRDYEKMEILYMKNIISKIYVYVRQIANFKISNLI